MAGSASRPRGATARARGRRPLVSRWSSTAGSTTGPRVRAALRGAGSALSDDASDAVLVAHAYAAWGPSCFERLAGEFAVCVWDEARRVVIAARDRFGVKPLFHAAVPGGLVVASSLAALRSWRGAPSRLADDAIADFLLFGELQDRTAHVLLWHRPGAARRMDRMCAPARSGATACTSGSGRVEPVRYRDAARLRRAVSRRARGGGARARQRVAGQPDDERRPGFL